MYYNIDGLCITIDNYILKRVEHIRLFGVIFHQNLSWQPYIKDISSKVAKSIGIITKSRQFFLTNTLCTLYNSLYSTPLPTIIVLPFGPLHIPLIYICVQPIFRLQKKALRITTHSPPQAHHYPLFRTLTF